MAAHEDGRVALRAEELEAIDRTLSPREDELGLPSVRPEYVPAAGASFERDELIRRDVLRIVLGTGAARPRARVPADGHAEGAENPPGVQKEATGAPHPAAAPVTSTVTIAEPCSRREDGHG
jgi:hypothetical protein